MQRVLSILAIIVLVCLTSAQTMAQHRPNACIGDTTHNLNEQAVVFAKVFVPKPPFGRDQFYNSWARGEILFENGTKAQGVLLSYNSFHDDLFWLRDTDMKVGVVPKESITGFKLHEQEQSPKAHFRKVYIPGFFSKHVLLEVLSEGEYTLYCNRRVTFQIDRQEFVRDYIYYLHWDGKYYRFKPNFFSFMLSIPKEHRAKVRRILWSNQLRVSQESDLSRAIEILNQQLQGS